MTAYATRSPLQLLTNTHHMMGDSRRSTRRTSARLAADDAPLMNGTGLAAGKEKSSYTGAGGGTRQAGRSTTISATQVGGGGQRKRKNEYDENEDGFEFSRTSKRTKAPRRSKEDIPEAVEPVAAPVPARKPRKVSVEAASSLPAEKAEREPKVRRSTRNSGDKSTISASEIVVKKRRPKENGVAKSRTPRASEERASRTELEPRESRDMVAHKPGPSSIHVETSRDPTKIALPFADTPIIHRNQQMRKGKGDGHRRSSLGMRGRRASSLIDSGKSNALPHDEVDSVDFYKHIESEGPSEPRRMRQLLTWCGTRALGERPSFATEDSHAKLAAREIQQQLLKDFSLKSELSDWYTREVDAPPLQPPKPPQPNPKNLANLDRIHELEQQLARLQSERQTWETILQPPPPTPPPATPPALTTILPTDLGDPSQASILETLRSLHPPDAPSFETATRTRLDAISSGLEFSIDKLADSVHAISQYRDAVDTVVSQVLAGSARALEERHRSEAAPDGPGTRDVLRGLSRVLER